MNRRPAIFRRILITAALIAVSASQPACSSLKFWCWGCDDDDSSDDAQVHHIVLLWQKLPGNPTHRKQLIEASQQFADIPGVKSVSAGRAVLSDRDIVDDSFDVALILSFEDKAALQKYLDHPDHQQAVTDTLQPLVEKIVVYDFIEPYRD
jgi:hypothetical protein